MWVAVGDTVISSVLQLTRVLLVDFQEAYHPDSVTRKYLVPEINEDPFDIAY